MISAGGAFCAADQQKKHAEKVMQLLPGYSKKRFMKRFGK